MIGSIIVLFMLCFSISFSVGIMVAHLTWTPPIGGKQYMDTVVVNEMANVGLTILAIVLGWIVVLWLDRNVFNKTRYRNKKKKKKEQV